MVGLDSWSTGIGWYGAGGLQYGNCDEDGEWKRELLEMRIDMRSYSRRQKKSDKAMRSVDGVN